MMVGLIASVVPAFVAHSNGSLIRLCEEIIYLTVKLQMWLFSEIYPPILVVLKMACLAEDRGMRK